MSNQRVSTSEPEPFALNTSGAQTVLYGLDCLSYLSRGAGRFSLGSPNQPDLNSDPLVLVPGAKALHIGGSVNYFYFTLKLSEKKSFWVSKIRRIFELKRLKYRLGQKNVRG